MNESNRMSTEGQRGIFVSTHVPWGRERDMHGIHQRAQVMMQACLDAWGSVSIVLVDRSSAIRSPHEIEAMTDWLGKRLSGDFAFYGIPMSVNKPAAIFPVSFGEENRALQAAESLLEAGFLVPAIRFPTVARGAARLRITVGASHSEEQVSSLVRALKGLK